jgi:alanyl-tRNA synthetase
MTIAKIREAFLTYFEAKGHTRVPSASLVPSHDPTLLFTNAGMVPFKDVFLGKEKRAYEAAVSCQKCLRAGGKHNDLEQVGFTARHHTFFEMLGNFSFGKYFKKEAIFYAWEFSTEVLKLPKEKLFVTVHERDEEAEQLWKEVAKLSSERIFRFGDADNFWQMGETGPCGPCSELFYDRGPTFGCGKPTCTLGCGCDRFLEFWNLVFMQFLREPDGTLKLLPRPSVDTGAGLERLAMILENADSNYDTDAFQPLLKVAYSLAPLWRETNPSFKVLADHARACAFLIADGVMPSNEGRGYVLRRIIRRAVRHLHKLKIKDTSMPTLAKAVIEQLQNIYPELQRSQDLILRCLEAEEEQFRSTLERGLLLFRESLKEHPKTLPGSLLFTLYDTFGFPLDLTELLAREEKREVDLEGFDALMKAQKDRSRKHWKGSGEDALEERWLQLNCVKTAFTGYFRLREKGSTLLGLWVEGKPRDKVEPGEKFEAIFDRTPCYAEAGGQLTDHGTLLGENALAHIDAVREVADFFIHNCTSVQGTFHKGQTVTLEVDAERRGGLRAHHTATHLLHWALRALLGPHVKQAGSVVAPDYLRFDFTHFEALSPEHLRALEHLCHEKLRKNPIVQTDILSTSDALKKGALAYFGDKYGDSVRVLSIGDFSLELCGGTHVRSVMEIQILKIVSETSIAAGVRRIIARCGASALEWLDEQEDTLHRVKQKLSAGSIQEIETRLQAHLEKEKAQRRDIESLESKLCRAHLQTLLPRIKTRGSLRYLVEELPPNSQSQLKTYFDFLKPEVEVAVLLGADKGKAFIAMQAQEPSIQSAKIIQTLSPLIEGKGGGKDHYAMAGGKNTTRFKEVLEKAESLILGAFSKKP